MWWKCDSCEFETEERGGEPYKYCPKCGSQEIKKVDTKNVAKSREKEFRDELKKEVIEGVNSIMQGEEIAKLISKGGWEFSTEPVSGLKGVKNVKSSMVLKNRTMVAIIAAGEIDTENKIAEYPLEFVEIAKKIGAETVILMQKDYPCILKLPNDRFMIIAPRVE